MSAAADRTRPQAAGWIEGQGPASPRCTSRRERAARDVAPGPGPDRGLDLDLALDLALDAGLGPDPGLALDAGLGLDPGPGLTPCLEFVGAVRSCRQLRAGAAAPDAGPGNPGARAGRCTRRQELPASGGHAQGGVACRGCASNRI